MVYPPPQATLCGGIGSRNKNKRRLERKKKEWRAKVKGKES
jgi:hypothetical protein